MFILHLRRTDEEFMELSIKKCGLSDQLGGHDWMLDSRLPSVDRTETAFPVRQSALKGKDLLFIAGGIGLAPLRSVINYVRDKKDNYGSVHIIYGFSVQQMTW